MWLAVLDAVRSIAAERWVLTPLRESWAAAWPEGLRGFLAWADAALSPAVLGGAVQPVLGFPGWAVLAGLALLLGMAGYDGEDAEIVRPARRRD